jgi:predicted RNase H-like HicB family nuclease
MDADLNITLIFKIKMNQNLETDEWEIICPMMPGFFAKGKTQDEAFKEAEMKATIFLQSFFDVKLFNRITSEIDTQSDS